MTKESCRPSFAWRPFLDNKGKIFILGILAAGLFSSCGSKSDKIDITVEDGIEVVQNHLQPYAVPGELRTLKLKRQFSIDTKNDHIAARGLTDIYLFDVDSTGTIFLVRPPASPGDLVFVFSDRGDFIRTFGRMGQGPNELEYPNRIFAHRDRIGVVESPKNKVTYFDAAGISLGAVSWKTGIDDLQPLDQSRFLASGQAPDDRKGKFIPLYAGIADDAFESIKEIERYSSYPNLMLAGTFPEKIINGIGHVFLASTAGGRIYAGSDERGYEIRAYALDGKLIRKIRKEFRPVPISEQDKQEIKKNWEGMPDEDKVFIPLNWPAFRAFFGDEEGRLFVMTREPGARPGESIFDIFDRGGRLIARDPINVHGGVFSGALALIRGNRLYRVQEDADGYKSFIVDEMIWEK
jgi:hypothetical protein